MKLSKKILVGALLSSSLLVAAGCGKSGSSDKGDDEKVAVEVWLTPQWKGVYSADEDGADYDSFFKAAAEKYEKENPNVDISVQVIPGEQRSDKLSVAIQTKQLPDIFFDSSFALSEYAHMGVLEPLTDIIDDQTKSDISDAIWDNVTIGDDVYFYPFGHNPGTLVYNADMFKAAGLDQYIGDEHAIANWTPEDLQVITKKLKEANPDIAPMGLFAKNNQGDTWNMSYLRMFGNEFFGEDGKIVLNDASGVKALNYIDQLRKDGLTTAGAETLTSNDVNAMFQNQQVAISFTNSVLLNGVLADMENGKVQKFDARLANIPGETNPISFTYVTSSIVFNTGDDARTKAAKDFVKFFSSDEELVMASKNTLPVRESVISQLTAEMPYLAAYNENSEYLINFSNNTPGYAEIRNALFPELQALFTGDKTVEQALESFETNGNRIIEENQKKSVIVNK
ncbi:ABC transporter substrate-binding protein [Vagococcus zengguangii]|uniref:ABC transporter substrate-binding protein n=1 Tax=Vagococcus zengguangii TaxID=2571750 RepID=UPI001107D6ED|nr:extracellular solute-binding protein [Vagococcus zengguangii]TLG80746.1 extracellular solute-binding protein [Vagococcus zengguangii]